MPAPIRKKIRRWNDESRSRSNRAPALTVRDMAFPPEVEHEHRGRAALVASCAAADSTGFGRYLRLAAFPSRMDARLKIAPPRPLNATNAKRSANRESSIVSFDERAFRDALGVFPTGVAVVTA